MTQAVAATGGRARTVALTCGSVTIVAGLVVLGGWAAGWEALVRIRPGHPVMPPNTAASLSLLGVGVVLGALGRTSGALVLAGLAGVLPGLTLLQLATGRDLAIDLLILGDAQRAVLPQAVHAGRMSAASVAAVLALAVALACLWRWGRVAHGLMLAVLLVGHVSFVAHLYGTEQFHGVGGASSIAEATAVVLVVAGIGVACLRPDIGLPVLLAEPGVVGSLVRRFSAFAVVVPPLVGALRWAGQRAGWYDTPFGLAIMTLSWTIGLLTVTWWGGRSVLPVEQERDEALAHAVAARERLELVADASAAFASTLELDEVLDRVTMRMVDTLADGCTVRLTDPTGRELVPLTLRHRNPAQREAYAGLLDRITRVDEGIMGRVLQTRTSSLIADFSEESVRAEAIPDLLPVLAAAGLRSAILAPLIVQDRVLGLLAVVRDENPTPFDERDLALVDGLAARAALAIDNAELAARQHLADVALTEFGRRALVAEDPEEIGQLAVDLLHATLASRYALLMVADRAQRLVVSAVAGPPGEALVLDRGVPVTAAVPANVLASGESAVCDDMRHDRAKGMVELGTLLEADSGMAVPVPGDAGPRGVLSVTAVGVGRFGDEDLGFIITLAGFLATALDRLAALRAVRTVAEERRALLDRLVTAQEDERARIADGVHEDQVQVITAVDLRLGLLARHVAERHPELASDVAFAQEAVSGAAVRLRDLLFDLQPPDEGVDLAEALRSVAAHLLDRSATRWEIISYATVALSDAHLTTAYRIGKEALSNTARHARAGAVEVRIADEEAGVLICVRDDGVGMSQVPDRSPAGHRGLSSMRDWAAVSGGWLRVESREGRGTAVRYWLPSGL